MSRERWMALLFALGSLCFLIGPFPGYADLVGPGADAVTFFAGSILFTGGGALQLWLSLDGPRSAIWSAGVQSAGTLFFNITTFAAMHTRSRTPSTTSSSAAGRLRLDLLPRLGRDRLRRLAAARGRPVAAGADGGSRRQPAGLRPLRDLGRGRLRGARARSMLDLAGANWNTALGAACFLACALATLRSGHTTKSPRLRRLRGIRTWDRAASSSLRCTGEGGLT